MRNILTSRATVSFLRCFLLYFRHLGLCTVLMKSVFFQALTARRLRRCALFTEVYYVSSDWQVLVVIATGSCFGKWIPSHEAFITSLCINVCRKNRYSYWLEGRGFGFRVPVGASFISSPRRPDLSWGSSILQWVPEALSRCVKITTHLQLVPRSRKRGSIHSLTHTTSWRSA
jgi:hypothetical protein